MDYNWALWQDCYDADLTQMTNINNVQYVGGLASVAQGGPSRLDDRLLYPVLSQQQWSYTSRVNFQITPRRIHSRSQYLRYSYEKGTFWQTANVDSIHERICRRINSNWFKDTTTRRRRLFLVIMWRYI